MKDKSAVGAHSICSRCLHTNRNGIGIRWAGACSPPQKVAGSLSGNPTLAPAAHPHDERKIQSNRPSADKEDSLLKPSLVREHRLHSGINYYVPNDFFTLLSIHYS